MKTLLIIIATTSIIKFSHAQEIPQSQVPSVILNQFNNGFPKATDVEWEMERGLYRVDFETGWNIDHEVWYDTEGKILKHKEDIPAGELPAAVSQRINTDFDGYAIEDVERITDNGNVVYKMELNALLQQDWDVVIDAGGNVLSKIAD